ncbi:lanthionine synthetase C family protein [Nonomuraea sp. NPDC049504]|uniref:lanthionine synthetase C family protein n=1 Tax=Nonomuraea sp. NPDC049504 TaxID=3154729 RepID=UPI00342425D6
MPASDLFSEHAAVHGEEGLSPALAERARRTTQVMVERLADERVVAEAVRRTKAVSKYPFEWGGPGLYGGHAGMALVLCYAAAALTGEAGARRAPALRLIQEAARHTRKAPLILPGLGSGTTGMTLAVERLAADEPRLLPVLRRLRETLSEQVLQAPSRRAGDGVSPGTYDVVSGAAGVLGYLTSLTEPSSREREAAARLLDDLVWMCDPREGRARWQVPPRLMPGRDRAEEFPHGYVDLGLAHGLAGPLAALSLAWARGHRRPGLRPAVEHVAAFLLETSDHDAYGRRWPRWLALTPSGAIQERPPQAGHESWCYGTPGITSALLDAAEALGDRALRAAAVDAFEAALRRVFAGHGHLVSASLCHGWSGLLIVCGKFARAGSVAARSALPSLVERVLDACDAANPLLVKEFQAPDVYTDNPDLLDGAAGVPLALWTVSGSIDDEWQRSLLIR